MLYQSRILCSPFVCYSKKLGVSTQYVVLSFQARGAHISRNAQIITHVICQQQKFNVARVQENEITLQSSPQCMWHLVQNLMGKEFKISLCHLKANGWKWLAAVLNVCDARSSCMSALDFLINPLITFLHLAVWHEFANTHAYRTL